MGNLIQKKEEQGENKEEAEREKTEKYSGASSQCE
jgi:hypothetical protein